RFQRTQVSARAHAAGPLEAFSPGRGRLRKRSKMSKAHPPFGSRSALKLALLALAVVVAACFSLGRASANGGGRRLEDKKKAESVKSDEKKKEEKKAESP